MFAKAYDIASEYTEPLVVSFQYFDKSVHSGLGTLIVLNNEGWLMTVAHNFSISHTYYQHEKEIKEYLEKEEIIRADLALTEEQKDQELLLLCNQNWVINFAIFFGRIQMPILESYVYNEHDIAFVRVDPSYFAHKTVFPKIKKSQNMKNGTSLCKLGFPFTEFTSTYDAVTNQFVLPPNLFPIARFPIEGIYTRTQLHGRSQDDTMDVLFLETSTPGLKGQSGGPTFDVDGNIYAVQSQTQTIPLGFKGMIENNGVTFEENQFLNVGLGVPAGTIETLCQRHNIKFGQAD